MRKIYKYIVLFLVCSLFLMCNLKGDKETTKESILKGTVSILVDETLMPIMEEQVMVFESTYDAKIKLVPKSEKEVVVSLFKDKSAIAVLTRNLTVEENKIFEQNKITPKITKFAIDAIAFVTNKSDNDTLVDLKNVIDFMKGKPNAKIKGLVFDNPNSSTVRYMNSLAGIQSIPEKDVYSFKTNDEVIKFVSENKGMIGVVGLNWLTEPMPEMKKYIEKLNVGNVKGLTGKDYFAPTQNNIAEGKYALARDLYIINGQGYSGLGMGFASFVAGDIGQRVVLKSGLLPVRVPGRKINVVK